MSNIAVVTDSISCLPVELKTKYNIYVAPCYVIWDKKQYRDGVDMTAEEAYARLRTSKTAPTTSSTIQGEFLAIFNSLRGKADAIITVTVTGGMGSCYSSALAARSMVPDIPIEVLDSRNCYMSEGFAAITAAKAVQSGATLEEAVQATREVISKAQTLFYVDGMEYIKKCGRVNLPQEILEKWMKTKVLMILKDGKLEPHQIQGNPVDQLIEAMGQMMKGNGPLHAAIARGDVDHTELKNKLTSKFNPCELYTCMLTPVAGVHTGPGIMGINFYNE